mmetsp:Transcript_35777/g.91349  ORF Transcript_35777/g.91349 Transcript_35777/m.91349 type:complete len:195 (-) Transcript_35777:505-1089(-)|eukprot:jgi/Tetstr1/460399/TSEL_000077.t1
MGKNQQHKAMQATRHAGSGGGDDASGATASADGLVDASFHTPEWHAARIAALTTERMTWEDWKIKKKEEDKRMALLEAEEETKMMEYRKQLDADRDAKLSRGRNHADLRDKVSSKKRKRKDGDKDKKKKSKKKKDRKDSKSRKDKKHKKSSKKRRRSSDGDSSSSGDSSDSDADATKGGGAEGEGDMRLSSFFE